MGKYNLDLLWDGKEFDIQYKKYSAGNSMSATHYHMHYEIYYQLSGDRYYFIKDETYYIQKGTLVWLNIADIHKTLRASEVDGERILINFKKDFLKSMGEKEVSRLLKCFESENNILQLNLDEQKEMETLLSKMLIESKDMLYNKVLLSEHLILSNRYLKEAVNQDRDNTNTSVKYDRITKIARYLKDHYSEKITLENVAETFYISPYYLSRTFKEGTGFNFINYLNYIRISQAKRLLEDTDLKVISISQQVGFENITHFNRVFKEIEGITPSKYRKEMSK